MHLSIAYITGALWAKRGEQGILREAREQNGRYAGIILLTMLFEKLFVYFQKKEVFKIIA